MSNEKSSSKNIILLKRGKEAKRNIFLIHDGVGSIGCYFNLCRWLKEKFNIYGITLDERVGFIPTDISIKDLANNYLNQVKNIQPTGTYILAGWSLGGTIAFEMANILVNSGDEVGCTIFFDTIAPFIQVGNIPLHFSLETEIDFIGKYITNDKLNEELKKSIGCSEFWEIIETQLQEVDFNKELFLFDNDLFIIYFEKNKDTSLQQMFETYNTIRTLHIARNNYVPSSKSNIPLILFYAHESGLDNMIGWNQYTNNIQFYEVDGNHNIIIEEPNSIYIADKINGFFKFEEE